LDQGAFEASDDGGRILLENMDQAADPAVAECQDEKHELPAVGG
jgi:hypothetical protein